MRLSRIEITNFKGIGARQVINLGPITLLFGPNSAGKSTILQSLHYVREVLTRSNPDPDETIAGGLIDLGGFANLIHGHDLTRKMTIKLVIEEIEGSATERLPINDKDSMDSPEFANLPLRYVVGENTELREYAVVQSIGVSLTVQWNELRSAPYVSDVTVSMDDTDVATISSAAEPGQAVITGFNADHPLLQRFVAEHDLDETNATMSTSPLTEEIFELSRQMAAPDPRLAELKPSDYRVGVRTASGALPDLERKLVCDLRDPEVSKFEHEAKTARVAGLSDLLDELMVGPLRLARDYLNSMTYIGPLRDIPLRGFRPRLSPDESRWAQGLAAWDLLYGDNTGDLLRRVNHWLGDKDRLGTSYEISRVQYREIPVPSPFSVIFDRGLSEDDIGEMQVLYSGLSTRTEIALRDLDKSITVAPSDVGVGISQMIPVIVGCLQDDGGLLAVEQPELHIHPAIQVGMGDLFIETAINKDSGGGSNRMLLVETHSEHIMLRLLRRIRETSENDLRPGSVAVKPENISVIYVENNSSETIFRPLRVTEDGDFLDRWPSGFFEERAEELF